MVLISENAYVCKELLMEENERLFIKAPEPATQMGF